MQCTTFFGGLYDNEHDNAETQIIHKIFWTAVLKILPRLPVHCSIVSVGSLLEHYDDAPINLKNMWPCGANTGSITITQEDSQNQGYIVHFICYHSYILVSLTTVNMQATTLTLKDSESQTHVPVSCVRPGQLCLILCRQSICVCNRIWLTKSQTIWFRGMDTCTHPQLHSTFSFKCMVDLSGLKQYLWSV